MICPLSPQRQHVATNPGWFHGVGHYGSHDPRHSPADIPQVSQNALFSDWFSLIQDGLWDVRRTQAAMRIYWNFCFKNIWSTNGWLISVHERRCKGGYQQSYTSCAQSGKLCFGFHLGTTVRQPILFFSKLQQFLVALWQIFYSFLLLKQKHKKLASLVVTDIKACFAPPLNVNLCQM